MLAYDPTHNAAEWVWFKGVTSDALPAEESAAIEMLDYVPNRTQTTDIQLDRIGETRTFDSSSAEGPAAEVAEDPTAKEGESSVTEEDSICDNGTDEPAGELGQEGNTKTTMATGGMVATVQMPGQLTDMGPRLPA